MKVFTSKEFIDKLKWLVNDVPNVYHSENGTWCTKHNGKVWLDCVVSIKGLLWGFKNDYSINNRGGAIYGSHGVPDFGANQGINYCDGSSKDFHNLIPGEYLCMKGTPYSHAGVYIGNGKVFECTTGWGVNKCIISDIDENGGRYYKGVKNLKWTWHGRLKYIDYSGTPEPPTPPKPEPDYTGIITYQSYNGSWQPEVNKCDNTDEGYAGLKTIFMSGLRAKPQYGKIFIESHNLGGSWNEEVSSDNYSSGGYNSYSGILGKPMDMIKIRSTKGFVDYRVLVQEPKTGKIYYLPWVNSKTTSGTESYAGIPGYKIMGIQMK